MNISQTIQFHHSTKLVDLANWAARQGKRLKYTPDEIRMRHVQNNLTAFVIRAGK